MIQRYCSATTPAWAKVKREQAERETDGVIDTALKSPTDLSGH